MKSANPFTIGAQSRFTRFGCEAAQLASIVTKVTGDAITAAKNTLLNGWRAIRTNGNPLASIGIAFLLAFGVGTFASWVLRHR